LASCTKTGTFNIGSSGDFCGVWCKLINIIEDGIHAGNIQSTFEFTYPDDEKETWIFQDPSARFHLYKGYGFEVTASTLTQITLKVINNNTPPTQIPLTPTFVCKISATDTNNTDIATMTTNVACKLKAYLLINNCLTGSGVGGKTIRFYARDENSTTDVFLGTGTTLAPSGIVLFPFTPTITGLYTITAQFQGDSTYKDSIASGDILSKGRTLTCNFRALNAAGTEVTTLYVGTAYKLKAKLSKINPEKSCGSPTTLIATTKKLQFLIGSVWTGTADTAITTGEATISYTPTAEHIGTGHQSFAKFNGTLNYLPSEFSPKWPLDIKAGTPPPDNKFHVVLSNGSAGENTIAVYKATKIPFSDYYIVGISNPTSVKNCTGATCSVDFTANDGLIIGDIYCPVYGIANLPIVYKDMVYVFSGIKNITLNPPIANPIAQAFCDFIGVTTNCTTWISTVPLDLIWSINDFNIIINNKSLYSGNEEKPTIWNYLFAGLTIVPGSGLVKKTVQMGAKELHYVERFNTLAKYSNNIPSVKQIFKDLNIMERLNNISSEQLDVLIGYAKNTEVSKMEDLLKTITPKKLTATQHAEWVKEMNILSKEGGEYTSKVISRSMEWGVFHDEWAKGLMLGIIDKNIPFTDELATKLISDIEKYPGAALDYFGYYYKPKILEFITENSTDTLAMDSAKQLIADILGIYKTMDDTAVEQFSKNMPGIDTPLTKALQAIEDKTAIIVNNISKASNKAKIVTDNIVHEAIETTVDFAANTRKVIKDIGKAPLDELKRTSEAISNVPVETIPKIVSAELRTTLNTWDTAYSKLLTPSTFKGLNIADYNTLINKLDAAAPAGKVGKDIIASALEMSRESFDIGFSILEWKSIGGGNSIITKGFHKRILDLAEKGSKGITDIIKVIPTNELDGIIVALKLDPNIEKQALGSYLDSVRIDVRMYTNSTDLSLIEEGIKLATTTYKAILDISDVDEFLLKMGDIADIEKSIEDPLKNLNPPYIIEKISKSKAFKNKLVEIGSKLYLKISRLKPGLNPSNPPIEIEGKLYDLASTTVTSGEFGEQISKKYIEHTPGLLGWLKQHKLATGIAAGWIFAMGPWFIMDNSQFMVYELRAWGIIPKTWADQWKDAVDSMESAYFSMVGQTGQPCFSGFQTQYLTALNKFKQLIDGANPIPTSKISKAKYLISVWYGFDIGDPYAELLANSKINYEAWKLRYFTLTQNCAKPLQPLDGSIKPELPESILATVSGIIDGDTISVISNDQNPFDWPFGESMDVRMLGVNTPEGDKYKNRCLSEELDPYLIRRFLPTDQKCKEETWHVDEDLYKKTVQWIGVNIPINSTVRLASDATDRYDDYDRFLAVPFASNINIPLKLLAAGNGAVFFYKPNKQVNNGTYLTQEALAIADNSGVWKFRNGKGSIACTSTPTGATIFLDGVNTAKATPSTLQDIPVGLHTIKFEKLIDLVTRSCSVNVTVPLNGLVDANCNLNPVTPKAEWSYSPASPNIMDFVHFTDLSTPGAGATITKWEWNFGDGTPKSNLQNPNHQYTSTGSKIVTLTVTNSSGVIDDEVKTISISSGPGPTDPPPPDTGSLTIISKPITGVSIFLDGNEIGTTPLTKNNLSTGSHVLKALKSGYTTCRPCSGENCLPGDIKSPCQFNVMVVKDTTSTYELTMIQDPTPTDPITNTGSLTIKAYDLGKEPISASIYIDNELKGTAPKTIDNLPVGNHTIRLEEAGFEACRHCAGTDCIPPSTPINPCQFSANVIANTTTVLEITMLPKTLPASFDAVVTGIVDGDTVEVQYGSMTFNCRLLGINAPEGSKDNYLVKRLLCPACTAETWNSDKILYDTIFAWMNTNLLGKTLTFKIDLTKQYDSLGRRLAVIFDGTTNICRKLLELGYAVVFFYDSNSQVSTTNFLASELIAQNANLGVWQDTGTIHCISTPTAAEIWYDGINTGFKTVNQVFDLTNVPVGSHKITFKKFINSVLNQCSVTVVVTKDATVNAACTLVPVFTVNISSNPINANLVVDGEQQTNLISNFLKNMRRINNR